LFFKPGFTIAPFDNKDQEPSYYGIDENVVWRSGFSVIDASNHSRKEFDANRIALLRLTIVVLSQPLYFTPDEYILVLNPYSTFLTNRRTKHIKNLFVSLVNVITSYDCNGYGIPYMSSIDQNGDEETLTTLCLHLLLILIEYKPPSIDNLKYLLEGGH
jgi:hypothetical protein